MNERIQAVASRPSPDVSQGIVSDLHGEQFQAEPLLAPTRDRNPEFRLPQARRLPILVPLLVVCGALLAVGATYWLLMQDSGVQAPVQVSPIPAAGPQGVLQQAERQEAMLKQQAEHQQAILKQQQERQEAMLKQQEDRQQAILKEQQDRQAAILKQQQERQQAILKQQQERQRQGQKPKDE